MNITCFTYKPTQQERHYLICTEVPDSKCTLNHQGHVYAKDKDVKLQSEVVVFEVMHKRLRASNYGLDSGLLAIYVERGHHD